MGSALSSLWKFAFGNPQKRFKLTIVGLDNAGKTTALYRLLDNVVVNTQPTIGSNVETIERKNVKLQCWDLGGQAPFRSSWSTFFNGTDAILFVVDSSDKSRVKEAKTELFKVLEDDATEKCCILVLANKQDLPGCFTISELIEELDLSDIKDRTWTIIPSCSLTGQGLNTAIDWIVMQINKSS